MRLLLINNSLREFRGVARISLGSSDEQKEIGQVALTLPPQETGLLQVSGVNVSGNHYTLAIYDQRGVRFFFKIAPLRRVSDPTPAITVALIPVEQQPARGKVSTVTSGRAVVLANDVDEFARVATQVQVQARLLANETANDSFILSLEFRSQRPIFQATIAITAGKIKDQKPVSINTQSHVEFKLPDQLDAEKINYTLTSKDGKILAKGDLELQQLMADDFVTVSDIRTDRSSYQPGETARLTVLLEGKAQNGYRLEISVRDGNNQTIIRDQKVVSGDDKSDSQDFLITLPSGVAAPVVFEFRIFNSETGLLFDSGEREIPISTKSSGT